MRDVYKYWLHLASSMRPKKMLDLCCGLKGASQPFIDSPYWDVFTVDIEEVFKPDLVIDVRVLRDRIKEQLGVSDFIRSGIDLIWCSPPCVEFYKVLAPFHKDDYGNEPDLSILEACKDIIDLLAPKYWIIENTQCGSIFINPVLGNYRQKIGPFFLWGNYPLLSCKIPKNHKAQNDTWSTNPMRSNIKAKIPSVVGENLIDVIRFQNNLTAYFE